MLKRDKQPEYINLLDTGFTKKDIFADAYIWLVSVGKYMLIVVQLFVLAVFFSRFVVDKKNNDLTEEINNRVVLLSNESWKKNSVLYPNYQNLLSSVKSIKTAQEINSTRVSEITNGIPSLLSLESFSFNDKNISLVIKSYNLEAVNSYETALKNNPDYQDVKFSVSKRDSEVTASVSLIFNTKE